MTFVIHWKNYFFLLLQSACWWSGQSASHFLLHALQPSAESQPLKSIHSVHSVHLRSHTSKIILAFFQPWHQLFKYISFQNAALRNRWLHNSRTKSNKCRKVPHVLVLDFMAFPISVILTQTVASLSSVAKLFNLKQANKKVLAQSPLKLDFWNNFLLVFH